MDELEFITSLSFGQAALKKMGPVPSTFRIDAAHWVGAEYGIRQVMRVEGAEFRAATRGPNKGKVCIMVPNTRRVALVTRQEMDAIDDRAQLKKRSGQ